MDERTVDISIAIVWLVSDDARYVTGVTLPENPTREQFTEAAKATQALPVPWVESVDISNAMLFLASDEARYVTDVTFPVDADRIQK